MGQAAGLERGKNGIGKRMFGLDISIDYSVFALDCGEEWNSLVESVEYDEYLQVSDQKG